MIDLIHRSNRKRNQTEWHAALQCIINTLETSVETTLDVDLIKTQLDELDRLMPPEEVFEIDIGEALKATLKKIKRRKIAVTAKIRTIKTFCDNEFI